MNEDEQILVFSVIKERIQIIALQLCQMKKYELYKDLMREIRSIESSIVKYQNELRSNVHKKQLDDYISIGYEMQNEFTEGWNNKFIDHSAKSSEIHERRKQELEDKNDIIYKKGIAKIESLKLKPSYRIRLLQNQEKLVAINERIEEASNYRNELKIVEKKDENRLNKLKNELTKNLEHKLEKEEKQELKKVQDRIERERNKLLIQKNKETNILSKQINLHINDIERIQNQLSYMYIDIGKKRDELQRMKSRQRQTNKTISTFKAIKSFMPNHESDINRELAFALLNLPSKALSLNSSMESTGMSKHTMQKKSFVALKFIIKNLKITYFDINNDYSNKRFCNVPDNHKVKDDNDLKRKIRKLLDQRKHKDEIFISPTFYYDGNLNLICDAKDYRHFLPKLGN